MSKTKPIRRPKRDAITIRIARRDAEILLAALADTVVAPDGIQKTSVVGSFRSFDVEELRCLLRVWKKTREAMRRLPFDWEETGGRVPAWARHR